MDIYPERISLSATLFPVLTQKLTDGNGIHLLLTWDLTSYFMSLLPPKNAFS